MIVVFKDRIDKSSVEEADGTVKKEFKNIPVVTATIPTSQIDDLKKDPDVEKVEKDIRLKISAQTQDWGIAKIHAQNSWSSGYTGKGVKIAILDTGISPHEDLSIAGGTSFVSYTTSFADDFGHGTHVAGIIGAKNNVIGTVGVAPDASLYAVKVLDNQGSGYVSDIISGIDWSITNHMNIINMSLGTNTYSQALEDAVNRAYNNGILVVAAAGNDGATDGSGDTVDYPARFTNSIAVGAIDSNDTRAYFSSTGPKVEVAAPGVNVLSTYLNNQYAYMSGTSMATPYVVGDLALLKQANPTMNNVQLRALLQKKVIDLGVVGRDSFYGYGLIQAPSSSDEVQQISNIPSAPANFKADSVTVNSIHLKWDQVAGATRYMLKRDGVYVYNGTDTTFNNSNLKENTTYQFQLVAGNDSGESESVNLSVKTDAINLSIPSAPTGFRTTKVTDNSVNLAWNVVSDANQYIVKRNGVTIYRGVNNYFMDKKLYANTTYKYEVLASNTSGTSNSAALNIKTLLKKSGSSISTAKSIYIRGQFIYIYTAVKDQNGKPIPYAMVNMTIKEPNGSVIRGHAKTNYTGKSVLVFKTSKYSRKGWYSISTTSSKYSYETSYAKRNFYLK